MSIPPSNSHTKNSFEIYNALSRKTLDDTISLASFPDVTSLFTNISLDLALREIKKNWTYIERATKIPQKKFLSAVKFVLSFTFFTFNNTIYQQTFGTPMGSSLFSIITDIVMRDLEEEILGKYNLI